MGNTSGTSDARGVSGAPVCYRTREYENFHTKIGCGAEHNVVVLESGQVFSWGSNRYGELGQGDLMNRCTPHQITTLGNSTTAITCGSKFVVALQNSGLVFCWGDNQKGQLGLGEGLPNVILTPRENIFLRTRMVTTLSCGAEHTVALVETGSVLSWGSNSFGQLGLGTTVPDIQPAPAEVLFFSQLNENVASIKCGCWHTVALSKSGVIYSWGSNKFGQLGLKHNTDKHTPEVIRFFRDKVSSFDCGSFHTAAVLTSKRVFTWGNNDTGQLGLGNYEAKNTPEEVILLADKQISRVVCGAFFTTVMLDTGDVMGWGMNFDPQLDRELPTEPHPLITGMKVTTISCGWGHYVALLKNGSLITCGDNGSGQLGCGDTEPKVKPQEIVEFRRKIGTRQRNQAITLLMVDWKRRGIFSAFTIHIIQYIFEVGWCCPLPSPLLP
ncbi:regulator of chromosome condensation RCC1 [Pelomyxa schiedti]|nr:regulator of chromosome condensation RCC1 [Pelomyxa schiedti]